MIHTELAKLCCNSTRWMDQRQRLVTRVSIFFGTSTVVSLFHDIIIRSPSPPHSPRIIIIIRRGVSSTSLASLLLPMGPVFVRCPCDLRQGHVTQFHRQINPLGKWIGTQAVVETEETPATDPLAPIARNIIIQSNSPSLPSTETDFQKLNLCPHFWRPLKMIARWEDKSQL